MEGKHEGGTFWMLLVRHFSCQCHYDASGFSILTGVYTTNVYVGGLSRGHGGSTL